MKLKEHIYQLWCNSTGAIDAYVHIGIANIGYWMVEPWFVLLLKYSLDSSYILKGA